MSLLFVFAMVTNLVACSGGKKDDTNPVPTEAATTGETTTESSGNVLKVQLDVEVASMDPQIATDGTSFEVMGVVTEGLYSVDAAGSPILAMAESVVKSEDGLKYTFTLRDAKWSNGTAVTADDSDLRGNVSLIQLLQVNIPL